MQEITYVSSICGDWRYYEQEIKTWVGRRTHCRRSKRITLDTDLNYLRNRTDMMHENIFRLGSLRQFSWIFTVKCVPIGDGIVMISPGDGVVRRQRKRRGKKERESKNLINSETHGARVKKRRLVADCGVFREGM